MEAAPLVAAEPSTTTPLDVVRLLRSGGRALLAQALLHGQLARIEWQEEKKRLLRMLAFTLLGFACLLCALLFAGGLLLAVAWDTAWRLPALAGLVLLYGAATALAWRRFRRLADLGDRAFAGLREELAADAALLRNNL